MARKGLIAAGRIDAGLGYRLMPFVVGIYEAQVGRIDKELAQLFENYYQQAFAKVLSDSPAYHRVIPIGESIRIGMEIRPYENALEIVSMAQSWGVLDCICRTQKALLGDPCHHPIDVCMIFSQRPEAFDHHPNIRAVDRSQAQQTLRRAADAGLVHSVTNTKEGIHYICNCCTCSCGILRGVSEFGIANAVASSSFINQVDETLCIACGDCITYCQFDAIEMHEIAKIIQTRCTGCGVCVAACTENALGLVRRPENEITIIPVDHSEWENQRMKARHRTAF